MPTLEAVGSGFGADHVTGFATTLTGKACQTATLRKARKLFLQAGSKDDTEPWQKPRWMRWNTFLRLVLAGRDARDTGGGMMLYKLGLALDSIKARRRRSRRLLTVASTAPGALLLVQLSPDPPWPQTGHSSHGSLDRVAQAQTGSSAIRSERFGRVVSVMTIAWPLGALSIQKVHG
jgi:hypothetical protein